MHNNGTVTISVLQDRVKFLSDVLENTSQAFGADAPDGTIVMCNQAFSDLTGYTKEELFRGLARSETLTPPEWRDLEAEVLKELNRTGIPQRYEKEYVRKDGSRVPVELLVHQTRDEKGNVLYYYSFITDITERKNSEEALRKYRLMFDAARDSFFMLSLDAKILDVNDAAVKTYGYSRDELLQMNAQDLRVSTHRSGLVGQLKRCFEKECTFETIHRRKDGSTFPVEISNKGLVVDGQKVIIGIVRDITDRKCVEKALRKNEEMLRGIIDSSPVPMVLHDENDIIIHINKKFTETFGYTMEEMPSINEWWTLAYPDEKYREYVKKRWYAAINHAIKNKTSIPPREVEVACKDGSKRHILSEFSSIGDVNLSVLYDITERKQAEEALRKAEEFNRRIIDSSADCIKVLDLDGNLLSMNEGGQRLLEITDINTYLNSNWVDFWQEKDRPNIIVAITAALAGGTGTFQAYCPSARGTPKWWDVVITPIMGGDGQVEMLLSISRDVTERNLMENALRESEERFRAFMNNSPAIAWMKDVQGRYVYLNKTYEEEFGVRSKDRIGKTDFDIWPREIAELFWKHDLEVLVSDRATHIIEEIPKKDGSISYWYDIKFPFKDTSGNMFVGGIGVDITRQKQMEEAYKEAKSRNELYVDLMGHDINNINQVAMGYLEMANESLDLDDDERELILKPLEAIKNSVSLIENVQKLKKLVNGGLRAEIIDLNDVLLELKDQYAHDKDKDITINYDPKPACRVTANGLLKDVFTNLIGNAIKHAPGNQVTINISLDDTRQEGKKYFRVAVEDHGPGIPDEIKKKIFNRFERGKTKTHGKGLGLYLVKTLVDDYHGKVWAEDRIAGNHTQGSRFIVVLPAFEGETLVSPRDLHRIGIVEDDGTILNLYKKILAKHGMHVDYTAINGIEAIDMVKNANPKPGIIIMDHRMPGMTGLEATREILKIAPKIKIIFASADASVEKEALKAGAYKFLHKPVTPKDIIKAITDIS